MAFLYPAGAARYHTAKSRTFYHVSELSSVQHYTPDLSVGSHSASQLVEKKEAKDAQAVTKMRHMSMKAPGRTLFRITKLQDRRRAEKRDLGAKIQQLEIPCVGHATKLRLFSQSSQFYEKRLP